jgi:PD-(D/E)XK nuclease superfamily
MTNEDFQSRFRGLKQNFETILENCRERDQRHAPDFNIFEIAGIESNEAVHSRMLSNLLNPDGSHGQGPLFLTRFIRHCENNIASFPSLLDSDIKKTDFVQVIREFGSSDGRPDIVIYSRSPAFALIIENKIYAEDQDKQLSRYRKLLDGENFRFVGGRRALIYLSLSGKRVRENGAISDRDYFRLSYKTDIKEWLQSCYDGIPSRLHELLRQYLDALDNLGDERPTEVSESDELSEK